MSNEHTDREINFHDKCPTCRHKDISETEEPCNDCVGHPIGYETSTPLRYDPIE